MWQRGPRGPSVNDAPTLGRRKGFGVKLAAHHIVCLHLAYTWMKHCGHSLPEVDALVARVLPVDAIGKGQTLRIRAGEIPAMVYLLEYTATLPFSGGCTFGRRAKALKKIDTHDLLADAGR